MSTTPAEPELDERAAASRAPDPPVDESWIERGRRFLAEDLWQTQLRPRSWTSRGVRFLQFSVMLGEGFLKDQLLLRASALTYMASLTLIPLLVVVVSIVKGVGVGDQVVRWGVGTITAASPEAGETILSLVEEASLGTLGTVGAVLTFLTTVLALRHAEETLNEIWGVQRGRTWLRRLADYLLVIVILPLVVSVAFSLEATLQSGPLLDYLQQIPGFEFLFDTGVRQLPLVLFMLGFTFFYWFLPNTEVRPTSALIGGALAAVLVVVTQRYLLGSIVGVAKYNALFGSFAAIPIILFWLYIATAIILLGAEASYAHQNLTRYRREVRGGPPNPAEREALGLRVATEVARRFRDREQPASAEELSDSLDVSVRVVRQLLAALEEAGIVRPVADTRDAAYTLGRPAEDVSVTEVMVALRGRRGHAEGTGAAGEAVDRVLGDLETHLIGAADERRLSDVLEWVPAPDA